MTISSRCLAGLVLGLGSAAAGAHHSFAVHYDGERIVSVSGVVEEFRFRNPHGMIRLTGASADGVEGTWTIETNSPNILKRRGWAEDSIKPGDEIVIEGFPANDGSLAMRVYRVSFADGRELIGQRPAAGIER
jgi:hypothetical protein